MIDAMDKLCDTLYKALDEVSEKPLTTSSLDNIFKIVGSIYKLEKMERKDDGYSSNSSYARRSSMGYGRNSYGRDNYMRGNSNDYIMGASRHNKEDVKMELYKLMQDADDENVKDMLQSFIREMEN